MPLKLDLVDVLNSHKDTILDEIWTAIPAVVVSNSAPGRVNVQPLIRNPLLSEDGNIAGSEQLPSISDVPLAITKGGGAIVSVPVLPGDTVMLLFSKLSMDSFRVGPGETPNDPGWVQKLGYDSCIAMPCVFPDAKTPVDFSLTDVVLGFDGTEAQVRVNAAGISLGKTATDFVALASKVDTMMAAISTYAAAVGTCFGTIPAPCVPTGLAAYVTAQDVLTGAIVPCGSVFVRCE